ncbi:response regulator receiver domain-containing protein [Pacificibacter maritimus]|uniref:Response regulator receiver domain-containing protein n=1 Tax=Pacificibacter maritimus TaxID=762213 RepID=A0A3N4UWA0_9RHOB|nr:response regulator [Pacificibacter maritimus]RPE71821.1 response regulator receiver domain-containing protein [Pacificibacter maritimus]
MGKRVLLIEDEPNIIEAIRFILSRDGWSVEIQSDGARAIDAVRTKHPDIVILDVMLPGMSGFEILRLLRQDPAHADLPILMLTARGQKKDRDLAQSYGVSAFMTKPFSNADMLETVRSLVAQAHQTSKDVTPDEAAAESIENG